MDGVFGPDFLDQLAVERSLSTKLTGTLISWPIVLGPARILTTVNFRPEYEHHWGNKAYYTQLRLDPFGRQNSADMLPDLLGDGVTKAAALATQDITVRVDLVFEKRRGRTGGGSFFQELSCNGGRMRILVTGSSGWDKPRCRG